MTITINPARNEYTATQGQKDFTYTFKIYQNTDLNVYVTPAGQEANDLTDIVTGYSVYGVGNNYGGYITLLNPANENDLVTIVSNIPFERKVDYQFNGDFVPSTVNNDIDRTVSLAKQVEDISRRTFVFEQSQQGVLDLSIGQPIPNYYLRWDTTGKKLVAALGTIDEDYIPILEGLVDEAEQAAASSANSAQDSANCRQESFDQAVIASDYASEAKSYADALNLPTNLTGAAGKYINVKQDETGYQFTDAVIQNVPLINSTVLANWTTALNLNTVSTLSFTPVLWTGNGTSQDIVTGIDSRDFTVASNGSGYWLDRTTNEIKNDAGVVQASGNASWGNSATGLSKVHIKSRSVTGSHRVFDGLRGVDVMVLTDLTNAEVTTTTELTSFNTDGFSVGSGALNTNSVTYVAYQELYTHIAWGTTNQGKLYVEAYNPITGAGMIYYIGSGLTDHRIPHSQGVALDYFDTKDLTNANGWMSIRRAGYNLALQSTAVEVLSPERALDINDTYVSIGTSANLNSLNSEYICYYKRNSDVWRIAEVTTDSNGDFSYNFGFNISRVIIKATSATSNWDVMDNKRGSAKVIQLNASDAETTSATLSFSSSTISFNGTTAGVTYIVMTEADTNADGGGSYFDRPTDGLLNVNNGIFNYSKGLTEKGYDLSSKTVTKSIDASAVANGEWWVSENEDNTITFFDTKPQLVYSPTGVAYKDGAWYEDGVLLNPAPSFIPVSITVSTGIIQQINTDDPLPINQAPRTAFVEGVDIYYSMFASGLPTADPFIAGYCWNDNGVIKISGGI